MNIEEYLNLMHELNSKDEGMDTTLDTTYEKEIKLIKKWLSEDYVTDERLRFRLHRERNLTIFKLYYENGLSVEDVAEHTGYTKPRVYMILRNIYAEISYIEDGIRYPGNIQMDI